jgi:predicted deacylase
MSWRFAGTTVPADSATWTTIPVTADAAGSDLDVPVYLINGGDGPVLWYQACTHGDEHTGSIALRDFALSLSPGRVDGRIVAIPIANRSAFDSKSRTAPIDNRDLNRQFPGREDGTYSELLARRLSEHASRHADYIVDLHSGRTETYIEGYSIFLKTGDEVERESRDLCRAVEFPHAIGIERDSIRGLLFGYLAADGVPSIITESGGEGRLHPSHVDDTDHAIRQIARATGLLDAPADPQREVQFHEGLNFLKARTGGYFERRVEANERVSNGEELAIITDVKGETVQAVTAPYDGVVVSVRTFGVARPGDPLFELTPH